MEVDEQEEPPADREHEEEYEEEAAREQQSWQGEQRHWQATGSKDGNKKDGYQNHSYAELRPRAKQRW